VDALQYIEFQRDGTGMDVDRDVLVLSCESGGVTDPKRAA
jgi:hypothetical protein